jgi:hypothetical protein
MPDFSSAIPSSVVAPARYIDVRDDLQMDDLQGVFRGRSVRVKEEGFSNDGDIVFTDSAEGEAGDGELDPRDADGAAKSREDSRSEERRSKARLGSVLPDFAGNPEGFEVFLGMLRRSQRDKDYKGLKEACEKIFPDPSLQHGALIAAASILKEEGGDAGLQTEIAKVAEELMNEHGPEIRAGYNVSRTAAETSGGRSEGITDLRDFYRQAVFGYQTPFRTYEFVMENTPHDMPMPTASPGESRDDLRLRGSVNFLMICLSSDIESGAPSQEPAFLKGVVDGVRNVGFLVQAQVSCRALLTKFDKETGGKVPMEPARLVRSLLSKVESEQSSPNDYGSIAVDFGLPLDSTRINFMTQLQAMVRGLPPRVFPSDNHRLQSLESLQLCIDSLVETEFEAANAADPANA